MPYLQMDNIHEYGGMVKRQIYPFISEVFWQADFVPSLVSVGRGRSLKDKFTFFNFQSSL